LIFVVYCTMYQLSGNNCTKPVYKQWKWKIKFDLNGKILNVGYIAGFGVGHIVGYIAVFGVGYILGFDVKYIARNIIVYSL